MIVWGFVSLAREPQAALWLGHLPQKAAGPYPPALQNVDL